MATPASNITIAHHCKDGIVIPALETSPRNAILYLAGLLYCFLGIAIGADIFMCAIERITSATRKIRTTKKDTEKSLVAEEAMPVRLQDQEVLQEVKIWNPTVANLTLMALGSSAPEILLSIIEIVGNNFKAGDLGPGTIVGSAAYNLFCISAICVFAVKSPAVKKIEMYKVFIVTAFFGTFAYIWLLIILSFISPDVVEVWEAVVTLAMFFVLVIVAWIFDVELWKRKKADLREELELADGQRTPEEQLDADIKRYASQISLNMDGGKIVGEMPTPDIRTVRQLSRDVARTYPALPPEDQAKILAYRLNRSMDHDRLYYRIRACRYLSSASRKSEDEKEIEKLVEQTGIVQPDGRIKPIVEFSARVYAVDLNDTKVKLTIVRRGPVKNAIKINYTTVNGIAKKDEHFLFKSESLHFNENESKRDIFIDLVQGADWRPNHVFYVHLKIEDQPEDDKTKLGECGIARVRYPDVPVSFAGQPTIEFVKDNYVAKESAGWTRIYVTKRGKRTASDVTISYETQDGTAQENFDYVPVKDGRLQFLGQEYEKYIDIEVLDDKADEKDETFNVEITKIHDPGFTFGTKRKTVVTIVSDDNMLKNVTNVRKLLGHYMRQLTPGQVTWKEQILNAVSVNAGDVANATLGDCITHALAFPWKFAFAFIPPPSLLNGYPCFVIALVAIGFITAVVGDLASIFGCMVGIPDAVTAITLVALGTSLPDTFASKIAAENDNSADNAIGNVTGSNSVNVFLGLGLPWVIAAIYWASKGEPFAVPAGDLGFSVAIFMGFSVVFLVLLTLRRFLAFFGKAELGGPAVPKIICGTLFFLFWVGYVSLSIWYSMKKQA